jgi:hypothetical protein
MTLAISLATAGRSRNPFPRSRSLSVSEHGGFGAAVRVSVTKAKVDIQVAYTNPVYMANAYRIKGDLAGVYSKLAVPLGRTEEFVQKALRPRCFVFIIT